MKLLTLAKKLDFTNELEYFDYCISSYQNGNFSQSRELFKNMTKADRKGLILYIDDCYDNAITKDVYKFYFNLL